LLQKLQDGKHRFLSLNMTALQVCHILTLYQLVLPQCPVPEFGPHEQLLFIQLLQQLRASQNHNECLDLIHELDRERHERHKQRNTRHFLELQCLLQIQLQRKLQKLEARRKRSEDKLQKLEERNVSYLLVDLGVFVS
jgi:hypothetical protein